MTWERGKEIASPEIRCGEGTDRDVGGHEGNDLAHPRKRSDRTIRSVREGSRVLAVVQPLDVEVEATTCRQTERP